MQRGETSGSHALEEEVSGHGRTDGVTDGELMASELKSGWSENNCRLSTPSLSTSHWQQRILVTVTLRALLKSSTSWRSNLKSPLKKAHEDFSN